MTEDHASPATTAGRCITCSDAASVAEVRSVLDDDAEVVAGGRSETVSVALIDDARVGDVLLCHAGVAISRLEAGEHGDGSEPGADDSRRAAT